MAALLEDGRRAALSLPPPLARLLQDPAPLLAVLDDQPVTLLHGDPWPANVRRPAAGQRVWIDWEQASAGPAAADLASWLDQTPWYLERDIDAAAHLRAYLAAAGGDEATSLVQTVDAASVLWFLAYDVPRLGTHSAPAMADAMVAGRLATAERLLG